MNRLLPETKSSFIWEQLGSDFIGEVGEDFGHSVSISKDGDFVAIGAPFAKINNSTVQGVVRVFKYKDDTWNQQGSDLIGLGTHVSLSNNGRIIAVSNPASNLSRSRNYFKGEVKVYQYRVGIEEWIEIGLFTGDSSIQQLGISISISGNGRVVAMKDLQGTVHTYNRPHSAENWTQYDNLVFSSLHDMNSDDRDHVTSICLSDDGQIMIVGSQNDDENGQKSGSVSVYGIQGMEWIQLGRTINGDESNDEAGRSVSISGDGTTIAFGSYHNSTEEMSGQVKVFRFNNETRVKEWQQIGNNINGTTLHQQFGSSVSLSNDGKRVLVGSSGGMNTNGNWNSFAEIFELSMRNEWVQIVSSNQADLSFGSFSSAISDDGTTIVIGSPDNLWLSGDSNPPYGVTKVFRLKDTHPTATSSNQPSQSSIFQCFDNPIGWHDKGGPDYDCTWYSNGTNCEDYGSVFENQGKTADEACCVCGGGALTNSNYFSTEAPTVSPTLKPSKSFRPSVHKTSNPTPMPSFTHAPSSASTGTHQCTDKISEWNDAEGIEFTCQWYSMDPGNCFYYGDLNPNQGMTANEVCCTCGGGYYTSNSPVDSPQSPQSPQSSPKPVLKPTASPTISSTSIKSNDQDDNSSSSFGDRIFGGFIGTLLLLFIAGCAALIACIATSCGS